MTTKFRQPGEVVDYTPGSAVAVNALVRIGLLRMGVALAAIVANVAGSVGIAGVFTLAKNTSDAFSQGDQVWWDPSALECINAPVTGSLFLGYAFDSALAAGTTLAVKLECFAEEGPRLLSLAATGNQSLAVADFLGGDLTVLAPNTAALTLTLPSVGDIPIGAKLTIRKTSADAQAVTLDGAGSETIGGGATFATIDAAGDRATFQSDGTAWQLVTSTIA
jgi:predicted RecA/RadA family phage recombinase